jgi:hypothetical protein
MALKDTAITPVTKGTPTIATPDRLAYTIDRKKSAYMLKN